MAYQHDAIGINANLLDEPNFSRFERDGESVAVVNFTLVKKYGKGKEYIHCSGYGDKANLARDFKKGDLVHVFGYWKERDKDGKHYKNFILLAFKKIEKDEEANAGMEPEADEN